MKVLRAEYLQGQGLSWVWVEHSGGELVCSSHKCRQQAGGLARCCLPFGAPSALRPTHNLPVDPASMLHVAPRSGCAP